MPAKSKRGARAVYVLNDDERAAIAEAERSGVASEERRSKVLEAPWRYMRIIYQARALARHWTIIYRHMSNSGVQLVRATSCTRSMTAFGAIAEQPYGSVRTNNPDIRVKVVRRYRYKDFLRDRR